MCVCVFIGLLFSGDERARRDQPSHPLALCSNLNNLPLIDCVCLFGLTCDLSSSNLGIHIYYHYSFFISSDIVLLVIICCIVKLLCLRQTKN